MSTHAKRIAVAAAAVFANIQDLEQVYVTEDGNAFMPHVKNLAENHARTSRLPAPVLVSRGEVLAEIVEAEQGLAVAKAKKQRKNEVAEVINKAARDAQLDLGEDNAAAPPAPQAGAEPAQGTATTEGGEGADGGGEGTEGNGIVQGVVRGIELVGESVTLKRGKKVEGIEVLQRAFVDSELTTDQWNDLSDDEILERCLAVVDALKKA